ncbi:OmpA family protein [Desulfococcaceae bacterium HSG8]|nr:OmpA family protein [Desulfococcaceae bacterium HSG8]
MKNLFSHKTSEKLPRADDPMEELRDLLVGPLQSRFEEMRELMRDQGISPEEVSNILPEAVMIRSSRDQQIVNALEPVVEEAIRLSVQKNPRNLVDILVPVMLPAIKRAITTLIREMIQTFSATLEHGLSMRGLKWRFEAFKTKKPFGEVALLHSLVYQVEQVFLIHKETGLVLRNAVAKEVVAQDPDMVSAMLTAIQDFVRDSFSAGRDEELENLQFGDRSVWIEQSSKAVMAAVVRGNAPAEMRSQLRETLDSIHFEQLDNLRNFDGDTAPFEAAEGRLSDCLRTQFKEKERHPFVLWTFAGLLLCCIGVWSFFSIRNHMRWTHYLEALHEEPGIVITETDKRSGKYHIFGLRDPLSSEPAEIMKTFLIEKDKVKFNWELYHSSHPDFIVRRIRSILRPPDAVNLEIREGVLYASGAAPHKWIIESEKLIETIPGILGFRNEDITDLDWEQIGTLKKEIESTLFLFDTVSTTVRADQKDIVHRLSENIKEIHRLTQIFDKSVLIRIVGHTDSKGSDERNLEISQKRAEELFSTLVSDGIRPEIFIATGVGAKEPLKEELSDADGEYNRCVSFNVILASGQLPVVSGQLPVPGGQLQ